MKSKLVIPIFAVNVTWSAPPSRPAAVQADRGNS